MHLFLTGNLNSPNYLESLLFFIFPFLLVLPAVSIFPYLIFKRYFRKYLDFYFLAMSSMVLISGIIGALFQVQFFLSDGRDVSNIEILVSLTELVIGLLMLKYFYSKTHVAKKMVIVSFSTGLAANFVSYLLILLYLIRFHTS